MEKSTKLNRSARTGKIVSKATAKKKPKTTVTETITPYEKHRKEVLAFITEVRDSVVKGLSARAGILLHKIR